MNSFFKKTLVVTVIFFFITIFFINFSIDIVKNEIANILNSKRFEVFMFNQINSKLESFANKKLTKEEELFYIENFKKIYIKFKPIFDEVSKK